MALAVSGFYLVNLCIWSYVGGCVRRYSALPGVLMIVSGLVMCVAILFWVLSVAGARSPPGPQLYCTKCGHRLQRLEESGQWYCTRCGEFRLEAPKLPGHHF